MLCRRVRSIDPFLEPMSARWHEADATRIELMPTPLEMQPNAYIRASWSAQPYGLAAELEARSVHDGTRVAVRLQWADPSQDLGEASAFPDGAAVAFPVRGDPALITMGSEEAPIHAVQWLARATEPRSVIATGLGTSRPGPGINASASTHWAEGIWTLVIARDLAAPEAGATVPANGPARIGFALWNGANRERAGIKAFSIDWHELRLENEGDAR